MSPAAASKLPTRQPGGQALLGRHGARILALVVILVAAGLVLPTQFTVVDIAAQDEIEQSEIFDAAVYAEEEWGGIQATVRHSAVELATVLNAIQVDEMGSVAKDDLVGVTTEYGLITPGEAHVYTIKATGTVASVDTESSRGTLQLEVDGYGGPIQLNVYIGPRLPSGDTSVRDAVGISFGDFREQTEYGQVASEINNRVRDEVLEPLDFEAMVGGRVTVFGALTIRTFNLLTIDLGEINIIPVAVESA